MLSQLDWNHGWIKIDSSPSAFHTLISNFWGYRKYRKANSLFIWLNFEYLEYTLILWKKGIKIFWTNASTNKTVMKKLTHILARMVIKHRPKKLMQSLGTLQGNLSKGLKTSRPVLALITKCIIIFFNKLRKSQIRFLLETLFSAKTNNDR